ncbi:hypothetical protein MRX96_028660 [Rhipicephalus microplus]
MPPAISTATVELINVNLGSPPGTDAKLSTLKRRSTHVRDSSPSGDPSGTLGKSSCRRPRTRLDPATHGRGSQENRLSKTPLEGPRTIASPLRENGAGGSRYALFLLAFPSDAELETARVRLPSRREEEARAHPFGAKRLLKRPCRVPRFLLYKRTGPHSTPRRARAVDRAAAVARDTWRRARAGFRQWEEESAR